MAKGPKPAEGKLDEAERNELEALLRRQKTPQQLAQRARMILGAAEWKSNAQIARDLGAHVETVRTWRIRWIGLQAVSLADLPVSERLADTPRPGRPAQITIDRGSSLRTQAFRLAASPRQGRATGIRVRTPRHPYLHSHSGCGHRKAADSPCWTDAHRRRFSGPPTSSSGH